MEAWRQAGQLFGYMIPQEALLKTRAHLEHVGLLHWFSVVVGGDMVHQSKPEPDIFLLAAKQLNVVPSECVVVGDTPADVYAASAAGMDCYLVPDLVPANEQTIRERSRYQNWTI